MGGRHIICFGNELHGDDGFGPRIYTELCQLAWASDAEVFNAGIAGLDALRFLEGCRQAILVDALTNFGKPGDVCLVRPEELANRPQRLSGHGLGLPYLLEAFKSLRGPVPEILIVGVEVTAVKPFSPGLSAKTEQAVPTTLQLIRSLLSE
ncbi:MAG: hydrogenase maturation protease [Methylovulum miyakonense]|uniref:hydrogenase maturation protease n=1 Tax=Methylovulum miyakonense TaxID=645578 RepID=UPI003BB75410